IRMALANDDAGAAVEAARSLAAAIGDVDPQAFSSATLAHWKTQASSLRTEAGRILEATDIAVQRAAFFHLSKQMIDLHDRFGHSGTTPYYLTFCPMARNNAGAYW